MRLRLLMALKTKRPFIIAKVAGIVSGINYLRRAQISAIFQEISSRHHECATQLIHGFEAKICSAKKERHNKRI